MYPRSEKITVGTPSAAIVYDSIEHGRKVPDSRFELPRAVEEALALEEHELAARDRPARSRSARRRRVATVRVTVAEGAVTKTLAEILPEVMARLNEAGVRSSGAPFSRRHEERNGQVDLEAGFPSPSRCRRRVACR
jgi:hypothetical protein